MEALKKESINEQNSGLNVFAKYKEENGKTLNDILKDMLKSSLVKDAEKVI